MSFQQVLVQVLLRLAVAIMPELSAWLQTQLNKPMLQIVDKDHMKVMKTLSFLTKK